MPEFDRLGRISYSTDELCKLLYRDPELNLDGLPVRDTFDYNRSNLLLKTDLPNLTQFYDIDVSEFEFDRKNQTHWFMPEKYKEMDIADWVLKQCKHEAEFQRVAQELMMFQDRNLFDMLKFLKYLVDTMRANNIVWGVGRGSSVASYVLYLIGVHHINSLYYDIDIAEFLR